MTSFVAPKVTAQFGVYMFDWPQVSLRLDRVEEDKRTITAEVTIRASLPTAHGHIHQTRLNLLATRSRRELANYLAERVPEMDGMWDRMLEYAGVVTVRKHREGEPLVRISDVTVPETIPYRVRPLLLEGKANLIYGDSGTGKTYVVEYACTLVEAGLEHNGLTCEPGNVLYLDYEDDEIELRRRSDAIRRGLDIGNASEMLYRRMVRPLADDAEQVNLWVMENHIDVVVVDSAGPAVGGNLFDPQPAIQYFQALRSLGYSLDDKRHLPTTVTIGHEPKNAERKTAFGSAFWQAEPRSVWEVRGAKVAGRPALDLGLYHRKVNGARLCEPIGLHFAFVNEGDFVKSVSVTPTEVSEHGELAEGMSAKDRLCTLLKKEPLTFAEIKDACPDIPEGTLKMYLYKKYTHLFVQAKGKFGMVAAIEESYR